MRRTARIRVLAAAAAVLLALGITSCMDMDDRKPVAELEVEILPEPNAYLLDNRRVDLEHLKAELIRTADETRRPITHTCRAYVRLYVHSGASPERGDDLISFCNSIGLDQIENRAVGN